mgnify:CR=1 FL=1
MPKQSADQATKSENLQEQFVVVDETAVSDDNSGSDELDIADDNSPASESMINKKSSNFELSSELKLPAGISVLPAAFKSSNSSTKQASEAANVPSSFQYQTLPTSTTISIAENDSKQASTLTVDEKSSKISKNAQGEKKKI